MAAKTFPPAFLFFGKEKKSKIFLGKKEFLAGKKCVIRAFLAQGAVQNVASWVAAKTFPAPFFFGKEKKGIFFLRKKRISSRKKMSYQGGLPETETFSF